MNHAASGTNVPFHAQALYERMHMEAECGPQPRIMVYEATDKFAPLFFRWFREKRPDVVVSTNIQPYYWLTTARHYDRRQRDQKIPQDVAFVCTRSSMDVTNLAHVDLRELEQGRQAVDLVHQQLQHGAIGKPETPLRLLIPPVFVPGQSLPKRVARKR
jgi:DNA polymerase elongation subunit (family B)